MILSDFIQFSMQQTVIDHKQVGPRTKTTYRCKHSFLLGILPYSLRFSAAWRKRQFEPGESSLRINLMLSAWTAAVDSLFHQ